jgi:type 1 glutamine amidotransferase
MRNSPTTSQSADLKPLRILLVTGPKDHGASEHDYPAFGKRWATLLGLADGVTVAQADAWPTPAQFAAADVAVFYSANPAWNADRAKELDAYLARGGGAVFLHMAVHGHDHPQQLADQIGLAWGPSAKFRHGAVELTFRDRNHPITRGYGEKLSFVDETYWSLMPSADAKAFHLLADAPEEQEPRPLLWTYAHGKGRVFGCILGHYTWTFDDPLFRLLVLRGISWSAREPADRLAPLAVIGARSVP